MTACHLMGAITRTIKSLIRPLRVRYITWQIEQSTKELDRLRGMRAYLVDLERIECQAQVQMAVLRLELERGWK